MTYRARMRNVPWLVPGAIMFLRGYTAEHPGCDVLEFGGGASTIWFLRQGCRVVSYEGKLGWRERILNAAANRDIVAEEQAARLDLREWEGDMTHRGGASPIPKKLLGLFGPDSFDIVLVDGFDRWACLNESRPLVRPGGVLMIDNAGYTDCFAGKGWDWTCAAQGAPDAYNSDPGWKAGWATAWWQRPAPLTEAVYYDVFSEHKR